MLYPFLCLTGALYLLDLWHRPSLLRALVLLYCVPWMLLDQLGSAGVLASRMSIRLMTAGAVAGFLPASIGLTEGRLRMARGALLLLGAASAVLAVWVIVKQVPVYP